MLRTLVLFSFVVFGLTRVALPVYAQTSQTCQQKRADLDKEIVLLQKAIELLQMELYKPAAQKARDKIADIQRHIDEFRVILYEKMRDLLNGPPGCRPHHDIPFIPPPPQPGERSVLKPEQRPPGAKPPAPPKGAPTPADDGFAMVPFTDAQHMLG